MNPKKTEQPKAEKKDKQQAEKKDKQQAEKTKAIKKAKKLAKLHKKGDPRKKHRTFRKTRFYRPKTLRLDRTPKYARKVRSTLANTKNFDKWSILKQPLSTEKAMKKMEDENTMVFLVDQKATKSQIKEAFCAIHKAKVRKINTVVRADGKKKAYIKLASESDSLKLANQIGLI